LEHINPNPKTSGSAIWDNAHAPLYSDHAGGVHFVLCDGSVHFLSETVVRTVLLGLASRSGGETISEGAF
jgi:hypothetical protein